MHIFAQIRVQNVFVVILIVTDIFFTITDQHYGPYCQGKICITQNDCIAFLCSNSLLETKYHFDKHSDHEITLNGHRAKKSKSME